MAATRASGGCSGTEPISTKISKEKQGVRGSGSTPPERRSSWPRAPEARAAAPPFQAAKCPLSPGQGGVRHRRVKGDIWLDSGRCLHLRNKGDPGIPEIIIVTRDGGRAARHGPLR